MFQSWLTRIPFDFTTDDWWLLSLKCVSSCRLKFTCDMFCGIINHPLAEIRLNQHGLNLKLLINQSTASAFRCWLNKKWLISTCHICFNKSKTSHLCHYPKWRLNEIHKIYNKYFKRIRKRNDSVLWQKPIHRRKIQKATWQHKNATKTSITQWLQTDLGRSVGFDSVAKTTFFLVLTRLDMKWLWHYSYSFVLISCPTFMHYTCNCCVTIIYDGCA